MTLDNMFAKLLPSLRRLEDYAYSAEFITKGRYDPDTHKYHLIGVNNSGYGDWTEEIMQIDPSADGYLSKHGFMMSEQDILLAEQAFAQLIYDKGLRKERFMFCYTDDIKSRREFVNTVKGMPETKPVIIIQDFWTRDFACGKTIAFGKGPSLMMPKYHILEINSTSPLVKH